LHACLRSGATNGLYDTGPNGTACQRDGAWVRRAQPARHVPWARRQVRPRRSCGKRWRSALTSSTRRKVTVRKRRSARRWPIRRAAKSSFPPRAGVGWKERKSTRAELKERVEACLRRLRTEYIDVFHLHGVSLDDYAYAREELVPALQDLQAEGKVRFLGITEQFIADPRASHALSRPGGSLLGCHDGRVQPVEPVRAGTGPGEDAATEHRDALYVRGASGAESTGGAPQSDGRGLPLRTASMVEPSILTTRSGF